MRNHFLFGAGIVFLLFFSGCILADDSNAIAQELSQKRVTFVPEGLLVPPTMLARENYRNTLFSYRDRITKGGGSHSGALNAYLDGSLELMDLQDALAVGDHLVGQNPPGNVECGSNTSLGKALQSYQTAKQKSQSALAHFTNVQDDSPIANLVGVEYVQNATQTTEALGPSTEQRINQLKLFCGQAT